MVRERYWPPVSRRHHRALFLSSISHFCSILHSIPRFPPFYFFFSFVSFSFFSPAFFHLSLYFVPFVSPLHGDVSFEIHSRRTVFRWQRCTPCRRRRRWFLRKQTIRQLKMLWRKRRSACRTVEFRIDGFGSVDVELERFFFFYRVSRDITALLRLPFILGWMLLRRFTCILR